MQTVVVIRVFGDVMIIMYENIYTVCKYRIYIPYICQGLNSLSLPMLGMVIPPSIGNLYNGYINPYYWVDDHPLLYGNNGSLDPGTYICIIVYYRLL